MSISSRYEGEINILHFIEGARNAKGLTIIIDVFRAFSLECYLYDMGVKMIRPVGTIEEAAAQYIMAKNPECVSLVCMGNGGVRPAAEDELCAEYIKSILEGNELPDLGERVAQLRFRGGEHFFDKNRQDVFPEEDFRMCTKYNQFSFVICIKRDKLGYIACKEEI